MAQLKCLDPDELEAERDTRLRKIYKDIFDKTEEDFALNPKNMEEFKTYADYQEFVEEIIFNFVHGIDVEIMKGKVDQYRLKNGVNISKKKDRRDYELEIEANRIQKEAEHNAELDRLYQVCKYIHSTSCVVQISA
jgi:hypothetical protein